MGTTGSSQAAFQRAVERGNVLLAVVTAKELHQPLSLENALALTGLFSRAGDARFEPAAVRWLGRLALEGRRTTLETLRLAASLLVALPTDDSGDALRMLQRIARLHPAAALRPR